MNRILLLLFLASFISCNNTAGSSSESKALYDQVMVIHDEVMPEMKTIRQLSKKLKKIEGQESNTEIITSLKSLDDAHESMMAWMAQFDMPDNISSEEEIKYLNDQLISVKVMSDGIYETLAKAESTIQKFTRE